MDESKMHFLLRNVEVKELTRRCYLALIKYIVREPIWSVWTKPLIERALWRIPTLTAYLLALINYWRYYTYVS